MAIITAETLSANELTIDPVALAARCTLYNTRFRSAVSLPYSLAQETLYSLVVRPRADGIYCVPFSIGSLSTINTRQKRFYLRAGSTEIHIRRIHISLSMMAAAAGTPQMSFNRFRSVCPTIGSVSDTGTANSVLEPSKRDNVFPSSSASDIRSNGNTAAVVSGDIVTVGAAMNTVVVETDALILAIPCNHTRGGFGIPLVSPSWDGKPFMTIHPNEGLALTAGNNAVGGGGFEVKGFIEWEER